MVFGFRRTLKSLFNVRSWVAWDSLKSNASFIKSAYTSILVGQKKPVVRQTFEEAQQMYGYTESFLAEQHQKFKQASQVYLIALGIGIGYNLWLLHTKVYLSALVMVPFNFMLFAFYFRESFWAMQIEQRKLGLSVKEWLNGHLK